MWRRDGVQDMGRTWRWHGDTTRHPTAQPRAGGFVVAAGMPGKDNREIPEKSYKLIFFFFNFFCRTLQGL